VGAATGGRRDEGTADAGIDQRNVQMYWQMPDLTSMVKPLWPATSKA
jgi:hypothetical protein